MTERREFTDEELVAYLDGAADADLVSAIEAALAEDDVVAGQLAALRIPKSVLKTGLEPEQIGAPAMPALPTPAKPARRLGMAIPLAMAASFVLGAMLMVVLRPEPDWRDAVASYQALYVTETLAGAPQPAAMTTAVLSRAETAIGVDMTAATSLEGLEFKRAQMLAINGAPLLQMAYLDANGTPFALCITRTGSTDKVMNHFVSHDLAASSWVRNGVGFVLIGGDAPEFVSDLSADLAQLL